MALDDLDFDEPWLVVDVKVNPRGLAKLPATSVQYCEPQRPCTLVIGPGNHRRWEIALQPGEDAAAAATPAGTWALLARWLTPQDGELWRQASYRFHALVARQWRVGRVFVAGDAAHMQPPFLGQGMCQGIRDAANLAWKLAAVVHGRAPARLLDSYGLERAAHVRELTQRIKAVGAVVSERDLAKARARDARLLAECGGVVKDTPRQDLMPPLTCGLISASPGAGLLFPQPRLAGGSLMDDHFGCGWRLVHDGLTGAGEVAQRGDLNNIDLSQVPEADAVVAQWLQRHQARAAIVRPDHYVYGTASDAAALAALAAVLSADLSAVLSAA